MNTEALISEAISLPIEERALVVEYLLKSLNQPEFDVDSKWGEVASKRLIALQAKLVTPIDGEQVFQNIWSNFKK